MNNKQRDAARSDFSRAAMVGATADERLPVGYKDQGTLIYLVRRIRDMDLTSLTALVDDILDSPDHEGRRASNLRVVATFEQFLVDYMDELVAAR